MIPDSLDREIQGGVRLNGMILISLLLHVAVLALFFFSPSFPSPKLTFGPVYNVSLVSFSATSREQKSISAAKELMAASSAHSETVFKKRAEAVPIAPVYNLETRKKADPNIEKAMEEIRKKAQAASTTGPAKQAKAAAVPEKQSSAVTASQSGDAELKSKMDAYYAMIWSRIRGRWVLPQGILSGEALEAVIDVTILRNGAVSKMDFEKRSGNRYFDESAVRAIQKASPLPPLPAWIGGSNIDVGIRFHSAELKP